MKVFDMLRFILREYRPEDCEAIAKLFYDTVHQINKKDYTEVQLNAWADCNTDLDKWNKSFLEHYTVVAEISGYIAGFADIDETGYLDRLYVHKDYQGIGIGTALCDKAEAYVSAERIVTHASITAKGFFEKRGYKQVRKQKVQRRGVYLTNFVMEKNIRR